MIQLDTAQLNRIFGAWKPPAYEGDHKYDIGDWSLNFRGWMAMIHADAMICYWAAYKKDCKWTIVSPYPGPLQRIESYAVIDFTQQADDEPDPFRFTDPMTVVEAAAIVKGRFDRLLAAVRNEIATGELPDLLIKRDR